MYNFSIFRRDNPDVILLTNIDRYSGWSSYEAAQAMAKCFVNQIYHPDTHDYLIF